MNERSLIRRARREQRFIRMVATALAWAASCALGADRRPAVPVDSPLTDQTIALGRALFNDPRLSASNEVSCATCHRAEFAFSEPQSVSFGVTRNGIKRFGARKAPTIINAAFLPQSEPALFWDSHAVALEGQALQPLVNPREMNNRSADDVATRIDRNPGYHFQFVRAYGEGATALNLARAISSYERTIVVNDAPMQRFMRGDLRALDSRQIRGAAVFVRADCLRCHGGQDFRNDRETGKVGHHNIGVPVATVDDLTRTVSNDIGAGSTFGRQANFSWKTPTLLAPLKRAPYFHNGSAFTIEQAIDLHLSPSQARGVEIQPVRLSADNRGDLIYLFTSGAFEPSHEIAVGSPALP